jgi:hypothetical protein
MSSFQLAPELETDPYVKEVRAILDCFDPHAYSQPKKKAQDASKLGEASYLGGPHVQMYIGARGGVQLLVDLFQNDLEPAHMHLTALRALSLLLRKCPFNQTIARRCGLLAAMRDGLKDTSADVRRWCAHVLLIWIYGVPENILEAKTDPILIGRLESCVSDSWATWVTNDAAEMLQILDLVDLNLEPDESAHTPSAAAGPPLSTSLLSRLRAAFPANAPSGQGQGAPKPRPPPAPTTAGAGALRRASMPAVSVVPATAPPRPAQSVPSSALLKPAADLRSAPPSSTAATEAANALDQIARFRQQLV